MNRVTRSIRIKEFFRLNRTFLNLVNVSEKLIYCSAVEQRKSQRRVRIGGNNRS